MNSYQLMGTVVDHEGLTYSIGESTFKASTHQRNVDYYTNPDNFAGWDLLEHEFDQNDDLVGQRHLLKQAESDTQAFVAYLVAEARKASRLAIYYRALGDFMAADHNRNFRRYLMRQARATR